MQLLKSLRKISMSTAKKCIVLQAIFVLFMCIGWTSNALAIGKWRQGEVISPPWHSDYTYITVNNGQETRYVIMKDAKIVSVYKKNGAEYQEPIALSTIQRGDLLVFMAEGNRIYQIKKISR